MDFLYSYIVLKFYGIDFIDSQKIYFVYWQKKMNSFAFWSAKESSLEIKYFLIIFWFCYVLQSLSQKNK